MRQLTLVLCAATIAAGAPAIAWAASSGDIGTTVSVVNLVTAELSAERRNLGLGDGVRQNELIEAASDARSEFRLADDTKLALGPGARMVLDRFVYDSDRKDGNIVVDLAKGAFRFITGVASKPSYVVRVPNASITVRGTIFDVFNQDNGTSWILLHEGGVKVCNVRGTCRVLDEPGKMILVNDEGEIGKPFRWASLDGAQGFGFDEAFPFVAEPPSIDPAPIFTREALVKDAPPKTTKPKPGRKAATGLSSKGKTALAPSAAPTGKQTLPPKVIKPRKDAALDDKPKKRVVLPKTGKIIAKPPVIEPPKRDAGNIKDKGKDWKRFAEETAGKWIDKARKRRNGTDPGTIPSRSTIEKHVK